MSLGRGRRGLGLLRGLVGRLERHLRREAVVRGIGLRLLRGRVQARRDRPRRALVRPLDDAALERRGRGPRRLRACCPRRPLSCSMQWNPLWSPSRMPPLT